MNLHVHNFAFFSITEQRRSLDFSGGFDKVSDKNMIEMQKKYLLIKKQWRKDKGLYNACTHTHAHVQCKHTQRVTQLLEAWCAVANEKGQWRTVTMSLPLQKNEFIVSHHYLNQPPNS